MACCAVTGAAGRIKQSQLLGMGTMNAGAVGGGGEGGRGRGVACVICVVPG